MTTDISIILTAGQNQLVTNPKKCIINNAVCNDSLQHAESSCSVDFVYDQELFAFLALQTDVLAVVKDGQNTVFTGVINTDLSWTDAGNPFPIDQFSVTIQDFTSFFDKKTTVEVGLVSTTVADIVEKICLDCGVTIAPNQTGPAASVSAFILDEGKSYKDAMNNMLYQYGYSYTFNAYGEFVYFDYKSIPQNPETLDDEDIITGAKFSRLNRKYSGAKVTYNSLTKKTNELVYFEGGGYNSDNTIAPIILQPGTYYPFDSTPTVEADSGQVYQSFRGGYAETKTKYNGEKEFQSSEETSLLYTENHSVVQDWEKGNVQINRQEFGFRKASVRLKNIHASEDANLYSLSIRADAWYRDKKCSSLSGDASNPFICDCEYIYASADADALASILARFYSGAHYKVTLQTERQIVPGAYMNIDTGLSGFTATALCISSSYDIEKDIYSSVFVTVSAAQISLTRSALSETSPNKGALQSAQNARSEALSGKIRILSSLSETASENDFGVFGNAIYQYKNNTWVLISSGSYLGPYSSGIPDVSEGNYFLAAEDFLITEPPRLISAGTGKVLGGSGFVFGAKRGFNKGYIYASVNGKWVEIKDRNDWRYIMAGNDITAYGFTYSPFFYSQINKTTPRYRGPKETLPGDLTGYNEGDWICLSTSASGIKGDCYRIENKVWTHLDPSAASNYDYYFAAFKDVIDLVPDETGRFSTIFVKQLMAQSALIDELQTKVISLESGGIIKSDNFNGVINSSGNITSFGDEGFALTFTGEHVFNDAFVRGIIDSSGIAKNHSTFTDINTFKNTIFDFFKKTEKDIDAECVWNINIQGGSYCKIKSNILGVENDQVVFRHASGYYFDVPTNTHYLMFNGTFNSNFSIFQANEVLKATLTSGKWPVEYHTGDLTISGTVTTYTIDLWI